MAIMLWLPLEWILSIKKKEKQLIVGIQFYANIDVYEFVAKQFMVNKKIEKAKRETSDDSNFKLSIA